MTTISTLFSGGEGVGVGAKAAGLDHLWGIEFDDAIASVARANGFNTLTGNVMDTALMMSLPRPDVLHASPVCKNASNAKADGEESPLDIATADATCAYITHFKPDVFTLENVWGYRTFEAFAHILICLKRNGYTVDYWHLNSADYGVAQTRKRLILVARLHGKPRRPVPTHARTDKITPMFDTRLPWVGWYEAIEDLIDTLPPSRFAPWQLERLPVELRECAMFGNDQSDDHKFTEHGYGVITRRTAQPSITLKTGYIPTAFIVHANDMRTMPINQGDEPVFTITAGSFDKSHAPDTKPRAFILDGKPANYAGDLAIMPQDEPTVIVTASQEKHQFRAFIPPFVNADGTAHERDDDEPIHTLQGTSYKAMPKAFIVNGDNASRDLTIIDNSDPVFAQAGNGIKHPPRAWLSSGRVVKMTPRALARFQSFPDWYVLPDKARLSCTVIGNAVPPLLYQCVIEAQR